MSVRGSLIRHPVSLAGTVLATVSAVLFLTLMAAAMLGLLENPYAGLIVFVVIPVFFVIGLLLIPLGLRLDRRRVAQGDPAAEWPIIDLRSAGVRRSVVVFTALTAVNLSIVALAGYGSLHYMDSPAFCGQTCHTPMHPQFTAWQAGPHSRIDCVQCHIGEGARGFAHAKLAGTRQLVHVMTGSFPRPVPAGLPGPHGGYSETCARCHAPGRTGGDIVRIKREYADDEQNSETPTVLMVHVGRANETGRAIHWHADPSTRVEFSSSDAAHQTIPYVKVTSADGKVKEYFASDATDKTVSTANLKRMECEDCHNMVGHRTATSPEQAVDAAIAAGEMSRTLPFARREGVRLLKASYADADAAGRSIDTELRKFYSAQTGAIDPQALSRAVAALQGAWKQNVFPTMKVTWGTYPDNAGHMATPGCFRCHDGSHTAKDGSTINADCEYCHRQVETPKIANP